MKFFGKKIFLTISAFSLSLLYANASQKDSINTPSDYSLLPLKHIWLQTSNPIAISDVETNNANIAIGYNYQNGDYRLISDPKSQNDANIVLEGYKTVKKFHFYGNFSYNIAKLKDQKWKDVLMPSTNNPFILADSIGGNYDNEIFNIKAGMASAINDKIIWGIALSYKGGTSSNNYDPRPLIDAMRFSVNPGIKYSISDNWSVGADLHYERYKEKIDITSVDNNKNSNFFLFQGLGVFFLESGVVYSRSYSGDNYGANFQLGRKGEWYENIFQLGYKHKLEKGEDGSSQNPFKSGDYNENIYSLSNIFAFDKKNARHIIKIHGSQGSVKGTWYDQHSVINSNGQAKWEVYNKSVKYKNTQTLGGAEYTFLKEKSGLTDVLLGARVDYIDQKETFYPELYSQKFSNITFSVKGDKGFWLPQNYQLSLGAELVYRDNLSTNTNFNGIVLSELWTKPIFDYLTSKYYTGIANIRINKKTVIGKLESIIYWKTSFAYTKSDKVSNYFDKPHRVSLITSLGVNF